MLGEEVLLDAWWNEDRRLNVRARDLCCKKHRVSRASIEVIFASRG